MLSAEQRHLALNALLGHRPLDSLARDAGITQARLRGFVRAYLQDKADLGPSQVRTRVRRGAEIVRDRRGVPHVFAQDESDLFFALGYAQAQDRLWQLDYLRRLAYGTLSEVFGPETLEADILARTLDIGGIAERIMPALGPHSSLAIAAFSEGVNAWLDQIPAGLPVEFELLGYEPEPWRPVDSVALQRRWFWYLTGRLNVLYVPEIVRHALGDDRLFAAFKTPDAEIVPIVPHGYYPLEPRWPEAPTAPLEPQVGVVADGAGSNNWAAAAMRSQTGSSLLASDPHVYFSLPADWYTARLTGAGYDVAGTGYPGIPGMLFWRNPRLAQGLTNNICSQRDLYVEPANAEQPDAYRRASRWLPMTVRTESIPVKGADAHEFVVQHTDIGPIVDHLVPPEAHPSRLGYGDSHLALRWVGFGPSDETECLLELNRAGDVSEARQALREWRLPTWNFGFADADGKVGYQCAGVIPLRDRDVPGYRMAEEPADDWQGTIPFEHLPTIDDPERGWIASANNQTAPPDFPYPLFGRWTPDGRAAEIERLLESIPVHSVETFRRIQTDVYARRAARALPRLLQTLGTSEDRLARAAIDLLRSWDYRLTAESPAAAIYFVFFWKFHHRVLAQRLPQSAVPLAEGAGYGLSSILLADDLAGWFASEPERVHGVRAAFDEALDWLSDRFGSAPEGWRWGDIHTVGLRHPAARTPFQHEMLDIPPRPHRGGQGTIASAGGPSPGDFTTRLGANYRLLADLAHPDGMWDVTYPGQSGQPGSTHYADQVQAYLDEEYFRLPLRSDALEADLESRTRLIPKASGW